MLNIYFAGSIRGGREDVNLYKEIIKYLQRFGKVLTEHTSDDSITEIGEININDKEIYNRDLNWIKSSDAVIAEVSTPSLGVGFEITKAIELKKRVLCLYKDLNGGRLSAMIAGCPDIKINKYKTINDIKNAIDEFL